MIGSSAKIKEGDKLTLFDLLHGIIIPSGNDASHLLAYHFGNIIFKSKEQNRQKVCSSPVDYFLQEGNRLLKEQLGLDKNTYFASPHGLSNNLNKTTCFDMGVITINCFKIELIRQAF